MNISVVVVDPHPLAREGLKAGLEQQTTHPGIKFVVVGETGYADDIHSLVEQCKPRLIVSETEILLRGKPERRTDASQTLERVADPTSNIVIMFYTASSDNVHIANAQKLGAVEYLMKSDPWTVSLGHIAHALLYGGYRENSPLAKHLKGRTKMHDDFPLTNREIEVLRILPGKTNGQIGEKLKISIETVKEHIANILQKLGVGDRTEAAVWAVKKGLV